MSTRSIYQKTCPSCAALVEIAARQCACGFSFDATVEPADPSTEDLALQEEELLKEYFSARIDQAVAELQSIQSVLAADPKNMDKANQLMRAYVALRKLRAESGAQSADTEATKLDARRERAWETGEAPNAISSEPNETFRTGQAQRAEQIMQAAGMDTKACPKCRAVIPERAALCFCGFAFTRDDASAPQPVAVPDIESHKNI